jgi:ATP-dependent protease HslVU (ClpYQ) peptidase subunit
MTTLAAIQGNGWCVLGAESKASDDDGSFCYMPDSKIFANGPALIAGSGSVRGLNILEHGWTAPRYRGKTPEYYLTRYFIPSMRKAIIDAGAEIKSDDKVASFDSGLLVAIKGVLFSISDDYSWDKSTDGLYRAGSGGDYALGALKLLKADKAKSPKEASHLLELAIEVAISCDNFSGGAITLSTQYA